MRRDPTEALTSISLLHCCGKDRTDHQRREACGSSRRRHAATMDPARHAGLDRHKVWLRRGCLWCLHGVGERPSAAIVPDPVLGRGGAQFHHHRRTLAQRQSSVSTRVAGRRSGAMWLLPSRHDYDCMRIVAGKSKPERRADRSRHVGLGLSLRNLSANAQRDPSRRGGDAG